MLSNSSNSQNNETLGIIFREKGSISHSKGKIRILVKLEKE